AIIELSVTGRDRGSFVCRRAQGERQSAQPHKWSLGSSEENIMTPDQTLVTIDLAVGEPIPISEAAANALIEQHWVRSESRRGSILVIGPSLVRLSDEDGTWSVERLPWPASIALDSSH